MGPEGQTVVGTDLGEHGEGIARLPDGMTLFVPDLLPGEKATVRETVRKPRYAQGTLVERLEASPRRRTPPCGVFPACGGCQLQHLTEDGQREWKARNVAETLRRVGGIETPVPPVLPSPLDWAYRHKLSFPVGEVDGKPRLGFYRTGSHEVVPTTECPVGFAGHEAILNAVLGFLEKERIAPWRGPGAGHLRHVVLRKSHTGGMGVVLVASRNLPEFKGLWPVLKGAGVQGLAVNVNDRPGNAIYGKQTLTLGGDANLVEHLGGLSFHLAPTAFFQLNPAQAERLYEVALAHFSGSEKTVVDLYCGTGTLTLLAAKRLGVGCRVVGIESHGPALESARENARENQLASVEFVCAESAAGMAALVAEGFRPDVVLLNPPRTGSDAVTLAAILQTAPSKIIYISCKPATLARDLKVLVAGGYRVSAVQPVDLFPQTVHIETVVMLETGL